MVPENDVQYLLRELRSVERFLDAGKGNGIMLFIGLFGA
jgi:hypothetical protein